MTGRPPTGGAIGDDELDRWRSLEPGGIDPDDRPRERPWNDDDSRNAREVAWQRSRHPEMAPSQRSDNIQKFLNWKFLVFVPLLIVGGAAVYQWLTDDTVNFNELSPGDCVSLDLSASEATGAERVPCDQSHNAEVIGEYQIELSQFPADPVAAERAYSVGLAECVEDFKVYVGRSINTSTLDIIYYTPTEQAWNRGDRSMTCFVAYEDGRDATSTFKGSDL